MSQKKHLKLKVIFILILIISSILLSFIYMFFRDLPVFFNLFDHYIHDGNSFFLPFLPYISIVPEIYYTVPFTLGHLVDIIIVYNIIAYVEIGIYHYIQVAFFNKDILFFFNLDSHLLGSSEMLYVLYQDPNTLYVQQDEESCPQDYNHIEIIDNDILNARNQNICDYLRRIRNKSNKGQIKLLQRSVKLAQNKIKRSLRFSSTPVEDFQISSFINYYHFSQLHDITNSNEPFHWEDD